MSKRLMLINYVPGEESRIAIAEDGRLEELYQERAGSESHVGNIYKGRVTNVEPAIQAVFVDFGLERNGFLHISDLHPMYFPAEAREELEAVGKKTPRRERPPIQQCLRRGQEILVQVLKEGIGSKGPTLTSYLSIPGRYLVMMPFMERLGVSRKIEDDEQRRTVRKMLDELDPPDGFGFIIRTAGLDRTKTDLKRDMAYLQRLWKALEKRRGAIRVGELYAESDLVIRTLRDVYSSDIDKVIVDDVEAAQRAAEFLAISNPRSGSAVMVYDDPVPLFHRYDIERQIENIHAREVPLPSGGSLVIEATEALVAIDVNSGRMRNNSDAETTAYRTNVEACDEICRQLRLRDLGGVVVLDLIDMRATKNRRAIEQRFRENLKKDRARTRILAISQFGIMEMTRQRMRPSLQKSVYIECAACHAEGYVRSSESVVLDVMRRLALAMQPERVVSIELTVSPDVAFLLLNQKRAGLVALEQQFGKHVVVRVNASGTIDFIQIVARDERGGEVPPPPIASLPQSNLKAIEHVIGDIDDVAWHEEPVAADSSSDDPADSTEADEAESGPRKKRRRRRRRGRGKFKNLAEGETGEESTDDPSGQSEAMKRDPDSEAAGGQVPRETSSDQIEAQLAEASDAPEEDDSRDTREPAAHGLMLEGLEGTAALEQTPAVGEPVGAKADSADESQSTNQPPPEAPSKPSTPPRSRLMQHRKPANRLVSYESPLTPRPRVEGPLAGSARSNGVQKADHPSPTPKVAPTESGHSAGSAAGEADDQPIEPRQSQTPVPDDASAEPATRKKPSRRRRGKKKAGSVPAAADDTPTDSSKAGAAASDAPADSGSGSGGGARPRKRSAKAPRKRAVKTAAGSQQSEGQTPSADRVGQGYRNQYRDGNKEAADERGTEKV
ncbi:MAG: Rne/Rng family ribonuclease [Phycisphaeraceae bacterium]|nr:Rne/Rng family ribonuclease [Phycisphaeraceae bacterium]